MALSEGILVVEDDADTRCLLSRRLQAEGYEVIVAEDGPSAIELLGQSSLDLVLLDVVLPGANGIDILREIRSRPETQFLPVIMVTALEDVDSKVAGFEAGADDYLTKPFDPRELLARIRGGLERGKRLRALRPDVRGVERVELVILESIVSAGSCLPSPDPMSARGYRYDVLTPAADAHGVVDVHPYLKALESAGCLAGTLIDTVRLCASCESHHINVREICPQCESVSIEITELVHHFKCSHVGPVETFVQAGLYACPKCDEALHHIGVDYEKPAETFVCRECRYPFSEPIVDVFCLACRSRSAVERCSVQRIMSYRPTPKGILASRTGVIYESIDEEALLSGDDIATAAIGPTAFDRTLKREATRARAFGRPVAVVGVIADPDVPEVNRAGERANTVRFITTIMCDWARPTGTVGAMRDGDLVALLPELDAEGAESYRRELLGSLKGSYVRGAPLLVRSAAVSMEGDEVDAGALLSRLADQLDRAGAERFIPNQLD